MTTARSRALSGKMLIGAFAAMVFVAAFVTGGIATMRAEVMLAAPLLALYLATSRWGDEHLDVIRRMGIAAVGTALGTAVMTRLGITSAATALMPLTLAFTGGRAGLVWTESRPARRWFVAAVCAGVAWGIVPDGVTARWAAILLVGITVAIARSSASGDDQDIVMFSDAELDRRPAPLKRRLTAYSAATLFSIALLVADFGVFRFNQVRGQARARREGRAVGAFFPRTALYETGGDSLVPRTFVEGRLVLRPHSRWAFGMPFPWTYQYATLDGRARFEAGSMGLRIVTAYAEMTVSAGNYEIVSVPGSGETRVVVESGSATVRPVDRVDMVPVVVAAGRSAVVKGSGAVVIEILAENVEVVMREDDHADTRREARSSALTEDAAIDDIFERPDR